MDGATGMGVGLPWYAYGLGVVAINPPWYSNPIECGTDSDGTFVDFCTKADVALGSFYSSIGERKIGLSVTGA